MPHAEAEVCDSRRRARLEMTSLKDLSAEERAALDEHAATCRTCAERLRVYQFVEDMAGGLYAFILRSPELEQMRRAARERARRRKGGIAGIVLAGLASVLKHLSRGAKR